MKMIFSECKNIRKKNQFIYDRGADFMNCVWIKSKNTGIFRPENRIGYDLWTKQQNSLKQNQFRAAISPSLDISIIPELGNEYN